MTDGLTEYRIVDIVDEIAMGPFGSNIKAECFVESGVPVFNGSNLTGFSTNDNALRFVTTEKAKELGNAIAKRGDVVVTHRGTLGQIAYIPDDSAYDQYVISQSQFRVRLNTEICLPEYLVYYFHTPEGQWKILSNKTQTGVPALGRPTSTFKKLTIPLPGSVVQKKVVTLLDSIQRKIGLNNRINGYLSELCDAVYANFIREKRGIDWHDGTLSELIEIKYGKAHKNLADGPYPVYGSGGYMRSVEKPLSSGESVLIPRKGSLNHVMYVDEDFWTVDTMFFTIPRMPGAAKYAYQYVKGLDLASMNAGSAVPSMTVDILNGLQLAIPCKEALDELDSELQPTYSLIAQIRAESKVLVELRDSLLPKLISGEIDTSKIDLTQLNSHLSGC